MKIVTIIVRSEVARARVLANSVAEHYPAASVSAVVMDATPEDRAAPEPFELLLPTDAGIENIGVLAAILTPTELREACKPLVLGHFAAQNRDETLLYLGADSLVLGPLEDIDQFASTNGVVVRLRSPRRLPSDGRRPNEADLRGWGLYDDGLIALGAGHDHRALLEWWGERGRDGVALDGGRPAIDRVATLGGQAHELADDGLGLSFFNLHGRSIVAHEQSILVDGSPLRLMRFPGFDPADPLALSIAQNRIRADEQPPVADLCRKYAAMLYDAGEAEASRVPYGFARLPDGTTVGHWLHEICRQASKAGVLRRSPFTRWGMEELYGWLRAPASTGAESGINRLCMLMCDLHPGLRDAYPDLDDLGQARGLIEWLYRHGVSEGTLPVGAVPPTTHARLEEERRRQLFELNFGVNVVGYLTSELGIGEGARLIVSALDVAEVPLLPLTPPTPPQSRNEHAYTALPTSAAGFPLNLICVNVDGLERFQQEVGRGFFEHRHNIGLWWWEVDVLPPEWRGAFELLDEIWVGTEHVARALTAVSPIPVHRIRMPIVAPRAEPMPREALGLDDERMFLSMFDHRSVVERKNPLGTIAAFAEAFAPDSGAVLVLKSVNAELDPAGRERVRAAAAPHPHVRLVEGYLSPAQTHSLIAACDCFVSLHRAEGFGLGPAEAMSIGKPVIATGYSGNLDFMTPANSYLVQYALAKVGPGCWPYPAEANWAEVDLDHAARLMREVFEDPAAAREVGARAAADLSRTHSAAVAGAAMRSRIEEIAGGLALEPFLPVPDPAVNLTAGRRGRLLRRLVPGITAKLERELEVLRAASERQRFDLYAAMRGPMLNAQASTLATLRRLEQRAPAELAEPDRSPRAARLYRQRR